MKNHTVAWLNRFSQSDVFMILFLPSGGIAVKKEPKRSCKKIFLENHIHIGYTQGGA
jgi:hypothetical protein